jgi:hypothetical protein
MGGLLVGWFRSRTRWGGVLALLALALQLAVSFGHIHADDLTVTAPRGAEVHTDEGRNSAPDGGHHDQFCDICATLHALAGGQVAAPPSLPQPLAFGRIEETICARGIIVDPRRAQFQSRAPPSA